MSKNLKISVGLVAVAVAVLVAVLVAGRGDDSTSAVADGGETRLVRADSHRLSRAEDGEVTFVEFLDFECEACGAAYPHVEDLRARYGDRITFVVRHFPLHRNSVAAARAAEAAAAQGGFEAMYEALFESQAEWGHSSGSEEDFFFGLARELGLDMDGFREVYDDPATEEKISRDREDGLAVGVEGTPTFFLNGEQIAGQDFGGLADRFDELLGD